MQFAEDVTDVSFDGFFTDEQRLGDFAVGASVRELAQYFDFTFGQFAARQSATSHLAQRSRSHRRINH
ncbi:MAG: hypothetical protein JMDDDDMK_05206 [Acidobacteria bacterium]|nr:hypothetical protein [Acidobacteriota bacterium]